MLTVFIVFAGAANDCVLVKPDNPDPKALPFVSTTNILSDVAVPIYTHELAELTGRYPYRLARSRTSHKKEMTRMRLS